MLSVNEIKKITGLSISKINSIINHNINKRNYRFVSFIKNNKKNSYVDSIEDFLKGKEIYERKIDKVKQYYLNRTKNNIKKEKIKIEIEKEKEKEKEITATTEELKTKIREVLIKYDYTDLKKLSFSCDVEEYKLVYIQKGLFPARNDLIKIYKNI